MSPNAIDAQKSLTTLLLNKQTEMSTIASVNVLMSWAHQENSDRKPERIRKILTLLEIRKLEVYKKSVGKFIDNVKNRKQKRESGSVSVSKQ